MPRRLRGDHHDIEIGARHDLAIMNVEAMREREHGALLDVGLYLGFVSGRNVLVGHQHHDDVGALHRIGNFHDFESGLLRLRPGSAVLAQTHSDLHA